MKDFRKKIRWYLAELTIVITGILIALALNAWWQSVLDQRIEKETVTSLSAEFRQNISSLERRQLLYNRRMESAQTLIDLGSSAAQLPADSLDTLWRWVLRGGSYDPTTGALNSATTSGSVLLIQDASLREGLAEWPSWVIDVGDIEDRITILLFEQFMPWLRSEYSIPNGFGVTGMPPSMMNHNNTGLYSNVELENYLRELVAWGRTVDQSISMMLTSSNQILEKLEARQMDLE